MALTTDTQENLQTDTQENLQSAMLNNINDILKYDPPHKDGHKFLDEFAEKIIKGDKHVGTQASLSTLKEQVSSLEKEFTQKLTTDIKDEGKKQYGMAPFDRNFGRYNQLTSQKDFLQNHLFKDLNRAIDGYLSTLRVDDSNCSASVQ